jgi:hypothetical protein
MYVYRIGKLKTRMILLLMTLLIRYDFMGRGFVHEMKVLLLDHMLPAGLSAAPSSQCDNG